MQIHQQMEFDLPAADVWWALGERFGDVARWAPGITDSTLEGELGVGSIRTCVVSATWPFKPGRILERLTVFDRDAMKLTYQGIEGLPGFMKHGGSHWAVTPMGATRCRAEVRIEIEIVGLAVVLTPLIRMSINRALSPLRDSLGEYAASRHNSRASSLHEARRSA
ncbi:MAG: SRPBCC family protein [Nannocystaceae bacterium]|nr:SRPBCC family protein [Nannocystaceae bacterium]